MPLGKRFFLGMLFGCFAAGILLLALATLESTPKVFKILLWNVFYITQLADRGTAYGYDNHGNPMYEEPSLSYLFFGLIGIISTFPYYSFIFFVIISIWDKLRPKKNLENTIAK